MVNFTNKVGHLSKKRLSQPIKKNWISTIHQLAMLAHNSLVWITNLTAFSFGTSFAFFPHLADDDHSIEQKQTNKQPTNQPTKQPTKQASKHTNKQTNIITSFNSLQTSKFPWTINQFIIFHNYIYICVLSHKVPFPIIKQSLKFPITSNNNPTKSCTTHKSGVVSQAYHFWGEFIS